MLLLCLGHIIRKEVWFEYFENWFNEIHVTTNGTLGTEVVSSLPIGLLNGVNLSF